MTAIDALQLLKEKFQDMQKEAAIPQGMARKLAVFRGSGPKRPRVFTCLPCFPLGTLEHGIGAQTSARAHPCIVLSSWILWACEKAPVFCRSMPKTPARFVILRTTLASWSL